MALGAALIGLALAPVPDDLPAPALGQPDLYRLEIALLIFYGCLALVTPAFSALAFGQLPIEISTRGAKFAEQAERSAERDEVTQQDLEETADRLRERLAIAVFEIDRLKADSGDST